jgi:hypothetical protein
VGYTLIVETNDYSDKGTIGTSFGTLRLRGIPQGDALRVVERFARVQDTTHEP